MPFARGDQLDDASPMLCLQAGAPRYVLRLPELAREVADRESSIASAEALLAAIGFLVGTGYELLLSVEKAAIWVAG